MKNSYLYLFILFVTLNLGCHTQTLSVNSTSISCATLGSATVSVSGGIGPFTFTWIPTLQTGSVATGLSPGTYSIIMRDAGSSTTSTTTTVFTSLVPFTSTLTMYSPSCFGSANGIAAFSIGGGSDTQNFFTTNGVTSYTTANAAPLGAGAYTYQVIDALTSCSLSGTFILSQPPALTLNIGVSSPTACANNSITLTGAVSGGTPGYNYNWTNGPGTSTWAASQNTPGAYIYTLAVTDANGCPISKTISVTYTANPTGIISTNSAICLGGTLTLSGTGGNTYFWSGPSGFNSAQQTSSISPLAANNAGSYSLTVTATNGCASTTTVNVAVGTPPTVTLSAPSRCAGQTLSLSANSSNGVFYFWSGPAGYSSSAQISLINQAAPLNSGTYTLTATTVNNCSTSATISVTVFASPTLAAIGSTVCTGLTASLTGLSQTGVTYLWSGPLGFSSTQQNTFVTSPSLSQTGIYTLVVTATSGCTNTATAGIGLLAVPVATITTNAPLCTGGILSLTGNGGFLYNWTGPAGFFDFVQNPVINGVGLNQSGVYNLTVTALNSCTASTSKSVTINSSPTISVSGSTVCAGNTLSLTANANTGSSFYWIGPLSFTSNTQNVSISSSSVSQSGSYTVLVTSISNCTNIAVATASVDAPPNINLSLSTGTMCAQGIGGSPNTVVFTGGGAPAYTLSTESFMSNSNPAGPSSTISLLPPYQFSGPTTVTLQGSDGICTVSLTAGLMVYPNPTNVAISNLTPSVCAGQAATLTASGANSYSWGSSSTNSFIVVSSFNTRSYSVTGTDLNGCSNVATSVLTIIPPPSSILTISDPPAICVGETATLAAIGASSYTWIGANTGSTTIVSPSITTIYTLQAANSFSCANTFTVKVLVDKCTGINNVSQQPGFLIYPNPAQEIITIQLESENAYQSAEIINNLGQIISSVNLPESLNNTINVSDLPNGIYYLHLKNNSGGLSKSFVINK